MRCYTSIREPETCSAQRSSYRRNPVPSAEVQALEEQLAAARHAESIAAAAGRDTSQMPGGVDSAPVNQSDQVEQVATDAAPVIDEGVDIVNEIKKGTPISDIANKLLDPNGLHSVVKAIGDIVKVVGL